MIADSMDMQEKYGNSETWRNFARRAQKNPYMRNYHICYLQNGICPHCGEPFYYPAKAMGHHINYDHECKTDQKITIPNPTPKRPNGNRKVPDCESCHKMTPESFNECARRIIFVHRKCHMEIHNLLKTN